MNIDTKNWDELNHAIEKSENILLSTHINPDGDGLGSEIAFYYYLESINKKCRIINPSSIAYNYKILDPKKIVETYSQDDDGYFSFYPRTLRTRESNDGTEYMAIPDVFHHVTLGGRLSPRHLMELGPIIKSSVFGEGITTVKPVYEKVSITKRDPVLGTCYTIMIIPYSWSDYGRMAQACLQFSFDHPEYIVR